MKFLGIVMLWLLSVLNGAAQATVATVGKNFTVSVTVIDSITGKNMNNASISLVNRNTNKTIRQAMSDDKGMIVGKL